MTKTLLPDFVPLRYSKNSVSKHKIPIKTLISLLGIDERLWLFWGASIPSPYAERIYLSNWCKEEVTPRFVSVQDALIIFKTLPAISKHFRLKLNDLKEMTFLPELESAYMIRHFGKFMTVFTLEELERKYYR